MPTNSTWCVMTGDILKVLPARQGHFLLESGYHTDLWFTLDALFVAPRELAPLITMLARRLAPYGASAVCGPLLGGAFLAQAVAAALGVDFFFTERVATPPAAGLFTAEYRLPVELQRRMGGHRVAIVDDVISGGSSVRAATLPSAGSPQRRSALLSGVSASPGPAIESTPERLPGR